MTTSKTVIAVDLGAESGRVMQVQYDGTRLNMQELHRFPNIPVQTPNTLYWDVLRLWHEISHGLKAIPSDALSIGVDTWGVDVALLDRRGELLANPAHYRDPRTDGAMDWVFQRMPRREVFERTGIQFMQLNGLYQLASLVRDNSSLLDSAETLLTIADLFNYWLTGSKTCEFTHFSTLQLYNPHINAPDLDIFTAIGIPTNIITPIVQPGTQIGTYHNVPVVLPSCHDTGSAYVAIPAQDEHFAVLSSGTWSLLGLELREPVINDASYAANLTNEGGVYGTWRLLKNIMGLWLVQQCRETWRQQGRDYSYDELVKMAQHAQPFFALIEPDDQSFFAPGDMPSRIQAYCRRTNQPVPESDEQIIAVVYESLALKYRYVLDNLVQVSGRRVDRLHVIGGGSQNRLLCQMTANAIGRPVLAGPVEATALGNAIVQLISAGVFADLAEARQMLSRSIAPQVYEPHNSTDWDAQFEKFTALLNA